MTILIQNSLLNLEKIYIFFFPYTQVFRVIWRSESPPVFSDIDGCHL